MITVSHLLVQPDIVHSRTGAHRVPAYHVEGRKDLLDCGISGPSTSGLALLLSGSKELEVDILLDCELERVDYGDLAIGLTSEKSAHDCN